MEKAQISIFASIFPRIKKEAKAFVIKLKLASPAGILPNSKKAAKAFIFRTGKKNRVL